MKLIAAILVALCQDPADPVLDVGGSPEAVAPKKKKGQDPAEQERLDPTVKPEAPRPKSREAKLDIEGGLRLTYDSNITQLDDRDVDRLEAGTRPDKFRIEQPDDFILSPWAELGVDFYLFDDPSTAGIRAQAHFYTTNSVANYQEIGAFFRHGIFALDYDYAIDVYKREYRDLDTGLFESAFYDEHHLEASLRFRPAATVALRPFAGLRFRDFDSPFNHRDAVRYELGAKAAWEATKWLEVFGEYAFLLQDAYASNGQPDTSYTAHQIEPGIAVRPAKPVEISLSYRFEFRDYTTDSAPAEDPGHVDRTDDRRRLRFRAAWEITKALLLDGEYRRSDVDSDLPHDPGATPEETSWERDEFMVGITYQF